LLEVKDTRWGGTHVIPVLRRLRQEDYEFEAILGSIARSCLKKEGRKILMIIGSIHHANIAIFIFMFLCPKIYNAKIGIVKRINK
jgi:hypothetical protein